MVTEERKAWPPPCYPTNIDRILMKTHVQLPFIRNCPDVTCYRTKMGVMVLTGAFDDSSTKELNSSELRDRNIREKMEEENGGNTIFEIRE